MPTHRHSGAFYKTINSRPPAFQYIEWMRDTKFKNLRTYVKRKLNNNHNAMNEGSATKGKGARQRGNFSRSIWNMIFFALDFGAKLVYKRSSFMYCST